MTVVDVDALMAQRKRWAGIAAQRQVIGRSRLIMPHDYPTPGALAQALDPTMVQTPALALIDDALVRVQKQLDGDPDGIDRLIISMPPQEGKSERVTHYGALWWLMRNPNLRIGLASYGVDIVRRHSYAIRNDIVTADGTEGNLNLGLRLRRDTKAAARWNLDYPHRGGIYATSIGGPFTGRPIDAMVIDDPVKDARAAESAFMSQAAWEWWVTVARARLAPGAPVVLVLTRWHELDLAGRAKRQEAEDVASLKTEFDRWHVVNIPAKADHDPAAGEVDILDREPGEYMESARGRTREQWVATENATPAVFWQALFQGRPSPKRGDVWQEHWWGRYDHALWSRHPGGEYHVVGGHDLVLQSWDMSFKDSKTSDFVIGQVWMKRGADTYLLDQVAARLSFTDTVAEVERMTLKWPQATAKLVEDKANGTAVIDTLKDKIPGLIPVNPTDSKYGRAVAVQPFIQSGNVHLPTKDVALPGFDVDAFLVEANAFPNGAHDDQVDATSQALKHIYIDGHGITSIGVAQGRIPGVNGSNSMPAHMQRVLAAQRGRR